MFSEEKKKYNLVNCMIMSTKKKNRASARAKREEEQGKRVMRGLIGALILLTVLTFVAFLYLGNAA